MFPRGTSPGPGADDTEVEAEEREHATERARREEPEDFENGDDKLDTQAGEKEKRPGVLSWLMGGARPPPPGAALPARART